MSNDIIISEDKIESLIFTIRGVQVMLDRDLAVLYEVPVKVLNQAVKRNIERFPTDFYFQLTKNELVTIGLKLQSNDSRSQIVTLKSKQGKNIKYLPYVFTEQGVSMLSAVLRSEVAINVSVKIIRSFVAMRKMISYNIGLVQRIEGIELKLIETDQKFEKVFKALENNDNISTQGIFFDGQIFEAYEFASKIIRSAKKNIVLIDNYIDETTLTHLTKKEMNVHVLILTNNISNQLLLDIQRANSQYQNFTAKTFSNSHDRFLIIDNEEVYHLGASLKDLGKKWFAFSKMDKISVENIMNKIAGLF